jgi:hypothetical protein
MRKLASTPITWTVPCLLALDFQENIRSWESTVIDT